MSATRRVYSTGPDGPASAPAPTPEDSVAARPAAQHAVSVRRERGGRRGKTVTVAGPLFLYKADAAELLKQLKKRCGSGGTLKPTRSAAGEACFELEIQGDQVERIVEALSSSGFPAKRRGG